MIRAVRKYIEPTIHGYHDFILTESVNLRLSALSFCFVFTSQRQERACRCIRNGSPNRLHGVGEGCELRLWDSLEDISLFCDINICK